MICYQVAKNHGVHGIILNKIYLTGLLHDISKFEKHIDFIGNGLIGGAIIEQFWDESIQQYLNLTKEDWCDISTCIDVHMCSYFSFQKSNIHKYSISLMPDNVKFILNFLRYGDQLATIYPENALIDIKRHVYSEENEYIDTLSSCILFEDLKKTNGILILLQGDYISGKSALANYLIINLGSAKCIYVKSGKQNNKAMMNSIDDGLIAKKIVIVNTIVTMFDDIETIIPSSAKDAYRIAFWSHYTGINNEFDNQQLTYYKDIYNPFDSKINWQKQIALTETEISAGNVEDYLKVHLAITIGSEGGKNHIMKHLINKIEAMFYFLNVK